MFLILANFALDQPLLVNFAAVLTSICLLEGEVHLILDFCKTLGYHEASKINVMRTKSFKHDE